MSTILCLVARRTVWTHISRCKEPTKLEFFAYFVHFGPHHILIDLPSQPPIPIDNTALLSYNRQVMTQKEKSPLELPVYPSGKALIEARGSEIFLALKDQSAIDVAYMFGLNKYFTNDKSMRSAIMRVYNSVMDNPQVYGIDLEVVKSVEAALKGRRKNVPIQVDVDSMDVSSLLQFNRDLTGKLIRRKLQLLDQDPRALKDEKLKDLGWLYGVFFDKGQIMAGKATEHIALMSNIPDHMDPEEALKAIMKMREEFELGK